MENLEECFKALIKTQTASYACAPATDTVTPAGARAAVQLVESASGPGIHAPDWACCCHQWVTVRGALAKVCSAEGGRPEARGVQDCGIVFVILVCDSWDGQVAERHA